MKIAPPVFVITCMILLSACGTTDSGGSDQTAAHITNAAAAEQFLTGTLTIDGQTVNPIRAVRSWLSGNTDDDTAATALTTLTTTANTTDTQRLTLARTLTDAVTNTDRSCRQEFVPTNPDGTLHTPAPHTLQALATSLQHWLWPHIAGAPDWFLRGGQFAAPENHDTGPVLGQPISSWWCLARWIRTDPDAAHTLADTAEHTYADLELHQARDILNTPTTQYVQISDPIVANPTFGMTRLLVLVQDSTRLNVALGTRAGPHITQGTWGGTFPGTDRLGTLGRWATAANERWHTIPGTTTPITINNVSETLSVVSGTSDYNAVRTTAYSEVSRLQLLMNDQIRDATGSPL